MYRFDVMVWMPTVNGNSQNVYVLMEFREKAKKNVKKKTAVWNVRIVVVRNSGGFFFSRGQRFLIGFSKILDNIRNGQTRTAVIDLRTNERGFQLFKSIETTFFFFSFLTEFRSVRVRIN